jgi:hypothetical protein
LPVWGTLPTLLRFQSLQSYVNTSACYFLWERKT